MLIAVLKNKPTLSFFVIIFGTLSFPIRKKGINTLSLIEVSGVVSGTTVRALVLGRFSQKKIKNRIERGWACLSCDVADDMLLQLC